MLPGANELLMLAIVLVAGVAFGYLATKVHLPAVTGQILVGIAIGPSGVALFGHIANESLAPITHFALGLIAVAVGSHLNFVRLRNAGKRLVLLLLAEATLTPLIVFGCVLALPGTTWPVAILLAAMAVSTAPATIVAIVKETRSTGVFVKTLIAAVALNNIACICLFEVAHMTARVALDPHGDHHPAALWLAPLVQIGAAAFLGVTFGLLLLAVTRRVFRSDRLATASIIAILLASGLADYFGLSSLLACLFLGLTLANVRPDRDEVGHRVFDDFESAILAVFFTLAGMELEWKYLIPGGMLAVVVVAARFLGKVLAGGLAMWAAGATERVQKYLGMALVPQAGVAVGLIILVQGDPALATIAQIFLAVGLTSVTLNEIIGPILTHLALSRSGELGMDRPRLIDFIHEENIVTNLKARTKEEAIARLTDLLIRSHHLSVDRERLLASIYQRESEASTCIGEGLAIPHGVLDEGQRMVGVMGLSEAGLDFDSPDGRPVHCMVLLATPASQRDRHLEVLAVLARVVGSDRNVRQELFAARTAAHAFDILNSAAAEEINPFLDDPV